jgi:Flp pilus assembly protein TadG
MQCCNNRENVKLGRKYLVTAVKLEKDCRNCRKKRQGAAAVEFAVIAPVFLLVILGMMEIGRVIMVRQIMVNASREGARLAVVDGSTSSSVSSTVQTYLRSAGIKTATVSVLNGSGAAVEPGPLSNGTPINVQVSVPLSDIGLLTKPIFFSSTASIKANTVMLRETVQ